MKTITSFVSRRNTVALLLYKYLFVFLVLCISASAIGGPLIWMTASASGANAFGTGCYNGCVLITIEEGESVDFRISPFFYDSKPMNWAFQAGIPSVATGTGSTIQTVQYNVPGTFTVQAVSGLSTSGIAYVIVNPKKVIPPDILIGARLNGSGNAFTAPCYNNCDIITITKGQSVDFTISPFSTNYYDNKNVFWAFFNGANPIIETGWGTDIETVIYPVAGRFPVEVTSDGQTSGIVYVYVEETCVTPPADMVAWWTFDSDAGGISPDIAGSVDNTGYNYNGVATGFGKVSNAMEFNGADGYSEADDDAELNFDAANFSFDAWVKTSDDNGVKVIVDKRTGTHTNPLGYSFYLQDGRPAVQLADGIPRGATGRTYNGYAPLISVADGTWHHIAITVERVVEALEDLLPGRSAAPNPVVVGNIRFYIDGVQVAIYPTTRMGSLDNTSNLFIGKRSIDNAAYFNGSLDEIELFNRVLSALEIKGIYDAGSSGKCKDGRKPNPDLNLNAIPSDGASFSIVDMGPVPAIDQLSLSFQLAEEGNVQIEVIEMITGRMVYTAQKQFVKGMNSYDLDVSGLKQGIYILTLFNGTQKIQQKFVKAE